MESIHNDIQFIAFVTLVIFVILTLIAVAVSTIVKRARAKRRASFVRAVKAHPAGKALALNSWNPPTEKTRHMDRPGWDWTSDTL